MNNCQICNSNKSKLIVTKKRGIYESTWVECLNCKSAHMDPYPTEEELFYYYNNNYTELDLKGTSDERSDHKLHYSEGYEEIVFKNYEYSIIDSGIKISDIKNSYGKILDYGCATGGFLKFLMGNGVNPENIYGCDIGDDMIEKAKRVTPQVSTKNAILSSNKKFDLITMWNVIEHIYDPINEIKLIKNLLNHSGEILIETPRYGKLASLLSQDYSHFLVVEHINLFSREAIVEVFSKLGFSCLSASSFGADIDQSKNEIAVKNSIDKIAKIYDFGATQVLRFKKLN